MIHFSHIVEDAVIKILNEQNMEIKTFYIKNVDFVNFNLPLEKGNYMIKVVEQEKETIKSIIVNK